MKSSMKASMLAAGLVAMAHVGARAGEQQLLGATDTTQALATRPAAGLVTSPECVGSAVPVAPAQSVVGVSQDGIIGAPIGQVLVTSRGPMYRLDASEPRGTHLRRKGPGFKAFTATSFASNGVQKASPWYLCTAGADGTWKPDSGVQLSEPIYVIPGDPRYFTPPPNQYYPDTIYTDGYINQFWVETWDWRKRRWNGDWLFIIGGTSGPVFNTPSGHMIDAMGRASDRYAIVTADYLIIVVYRPDAYKVTATCYAPEIGSVVSWAPPVPTCGTAIAVLD